MNLVNALGSGLFVFAWFDLCSVMGSRLLGIE